MREVDEGLAARLAPDLAGEVTADASLARHTTLGVGGPAAALVRADTPRDLAVVARVCAEFGRPFLVLGRGSNLLVADRGWPGVVVRLGKAFRGTRLVGTSLEAGGAESMPALARTAERHGLGGVAFGVAIPGSLGGAVRMNAGAHGRETSHVLEWAEVARLGDGARLERWTVDQLAMGYRHTGLPTDGVVVRARLALVPVEAAELARDMAEMRRWRRAHQPLREPSCGSVFRNPEGDSAGRLIEAAGLKGRRVGGARVSAVHANFITVGPGGTAAHVHELIRTVQGEVAERCGVALRTEVVMVGFHAEGDAGGPRRRDG